jgi:hypothetical protein
VWGLPDIAVRDRPVRPAAVLTDVLAGPSPFRLATTIGFRLDAGSRVTVTMYDMRGRLVANLLNAERPAGYQMVEWDGKDTYRRSVPNGLYTYTIMANGRMARGTVMKMK